MKIEIILLGVIGLVFLVDFIKNLRKKSSIDNVVDQIEGGEPVKTNRNPFNYLLKRKKSKTVRKRKTTEEKAKLKRVKEYLTK